jgi:hypothetical protein
MDMAARGLLRTLKKEINERRIPMPMRYCEHKTKQTRTRIPQQLNFFKVSNTQNASS